MRSLNQMMGDKLISITEIKRELELSEIWESGIDGEYIGKLQNNELIYFNMITREFGRV